MPISFHAQDNGFVHVCAHRGYSLLYPENTLVALEEAYAAGATTCEIDLVLTRDGEAILLHDATVDRTTDGQGFAADLMLEEIRSLNAAAGHTGIDHAVPVPTFAEALSWAIDRNVGLVVELKERQNAARISSRVLEVLDRYDGFGHAILLSFDHPELARIKQLEPRARTEAIVHARHMDILAVVQSCGADSVSFELDMFLPDDARAVHAAGMSDRVHVPQSDVLRRQRIYGIQPAAALGASMAEGLIDSVSGDDVSFLRELADRHPIRG